MFDIFPQPIFADASAVVGLLVLIFTVVGWLVNLANNQQNPPAKQRPQQRPPRPQRDRVQNEIDVFLKEVRGEATAAEEPDIVVESLPPETSRRRSRSTPPPPPPEYVAEPQRSRLSDRMAPHVQSHVGESLSSHHLESHFGEREEQPVDESLDPRAAGDIMALQPGGQTRKAAPLPLVGMLKDRRGIRQAILVNEILSKPKALRDE